MRLPMLIKAEDALTTEDFFKDQVELVLRTWALEGVFVELADQINGHVWEPGEVLHIPVAHSAGYARCLISNQSCFIARPSDTPATESCRRLVVRLLKRFVEDAGYVASVGLSGVDDTSFTCPDRETSFEITLLVERPKART